MAHLHTGKDASGGTGIAYVGGVVDPDDFGYAISEHRTGRTATEKKFTMAHEIGHVMGGDHPDSGPDDDYPEKCTQFSGQNCIEETYTILASPRTPQVFSFSDGSLGGTYDDNLQEINDHKSYLQ